MILQFRDVKAYADAEPRVHGNGFIQINLPFENRLHIWPDIPFETQKVYTGIHNHRFSLESRIVLGTLVHKQFDLAQTVDGAYQLYQAIPREGEDTKMELYGTGRFIVQEEQTFLLHKGSSYTFPYGKFHESFGIDLTATVMKKTGSHPKVVPMVACEYGKVPDNDYNRYQITPEQIWPTVERVFKQINHIIIY